MNYKTKLLIATTILTHAGVVLADETAPAAFKRGQAAMKAGKVHEACEAFADSDKLAATVDTELALAKCYEQDGKPIAAAKLYRALDAKDTNAKRKKASAAKATKLEAKAPKLRFAISVNPAGPNPPGLVVKVDGIQVDPSTDVLVDVGPHDVTGSAPGFEGHASAPIDKDGAIVDVILRMESTAPPPKPEVKPEPTPEPKPETKPEPALEKPEAAMKEPPREEHAMAPNHRKRNGAILTALGVAGVGGAVGMFIVSSNKFDNEHKLCPNSTCRDVPDTDKANGLRSDARTFRGLAYGTGAVGAALLISGIYMIATGNKGEEQHVSMHVNHDGAGMAWTAHF